MYMCNIYIYIYIYIYYIYILYIYTYTEFSLLGGWRESPLSAKTFLINCIHSSCTIFVLTSHFFETQIVLILILIDVQYSQNAGFSFEKFLNLQNHSSSGSRHLVKKSPQLCSLLFDTNSGKLLKFQAIKNSNFILKPMQ